MMPNLSSVNIPFIKTQSEKDISGRRLDEHQSGVGMAISGEDLALKTNFLTLSQRSQSRLRSILRWCPREIITQVQSGSMSIGRAYELAMKFKASLQDATAHRVKKTIGEVLLSILKKPVTSECWSSTWNVEHLDAISTIFLALQKEDLLTRLEIQAVSARIADLKNRLRGGS